MTRVMALVLGALLLLLSSCTTTAHYADRRDPTIPVAECSEPSRALMLINPAGYIIAKNEYAGCKSAAEAGGRWPRAGQQSVRCATYGPEERK